MSSSLVTIADIRKAQENIRGKVIRTPTYYSKALSEQTNAKVYLKLESYQPIRVFKIRGAMNKILSLRPRDRSEGVITASSGNHGLAVAYCARQFGLKATICVPENANPEKVSAIEHFQAKIVRSGAVYDDTYKKALELQKKAGAMFIHAFDDPAVIAGQGTIGMEILEDVHDVDTVFVPIGGGGLIAGIGLAIKTQKLDTKIVGVQAERLPAMYRSVKEGKAVEVDTAETIADGLAGRAPGKITLGLVQRFVDDIVLLSEDELKDGVIKVIENTHVIAEPSGAASLAAFLHKYKPKPMEKVVILISGGNISLSLLSELLLSRAN